MKRFYFIALIISANLLSLNIVAKAQSCPTVTVEAFPRNPQSGSFNYFGARVTLSVTWGTDVTVEGYIHAGEDENSNTDHPFTLTVTAGNLTAETSDDIYQTNPTGDAGVTIASISACPIDTIAVVANSSNSYDYIGIYHNNGMASLRGSLNPSNPAPDYGIPSLVCPYLNSLGYDSTIWKADYALGVDSGYLPFTITPGLDTLGNLLYSKGMLGSAANNYIQLIYDTLVYYLNTETPTEATYDAFASDLISIESNISSSGSLSSAEKLALLSACSVGRYSAEYWANDINNPPLSLNQNRFKDNLAILYAHPGPNPPQFAKYWSMNGITDKYQAQYYKWPKWLKIVARDIIGAVTGGITGHIPGAIAGGISGSATEFISQQ